MAHDLSVTFTGNTEQLQKALQDVKDRFEKTSASVKPLRQKLSELRRQMEMVATSELSQTSEGQELYNKLRESAQQYDKMLKQIQTDSRVAAQATAEVEKPAQTLSQKVADIKKQMEELALTGKMSTDEGKEMWDKLSQEAQEYDDILKKINKDTKSATSTPPPIPQITDNKTNIDVKGISTDLLGKAGLGSGATQALGALAGAINPVTVGITAVGGTMIAAGKATAEFETHLNSLQALTGLTDKEMKSVSDGAIDMSKNFTSSAGEIVDAMKLIGSQAPELLSNSDALMEVTKAANVLSEAAEIGVEDAAKAITGTMNQMGASASEATQIINTFAAASQQGSADVAYLNKAFEKSGTAASSAGMDYVQLASAIESVAPKFSSADVAGSQLASTLLKLSMSGNSDFMPSVVGMSKALENLAKAEMDDATMKNLVGESNITMLKSLIDAREQFDSYNQSLRGTNTAYEQMETNQKGFMGTINKLKSAWDAFLLTLGQSGVMQGIVDNIIMIVNAVNEIINVVSDVIKSFDAFEMEGVESINLVKFQIDNIVRGFKMMGTALQVVIKVIAKCFNAVVDTVKMAKEGAIYHWNQLKKSLMDNAFARSIINAFNKVIDAAANMCKQIKQFWNKLKSFLGMKVDANIDVKTQHADANVTDGDGKSTNLSTTTDKKSKKTKSTKTEKTEKIDYLVAVDDKSLDVAEKKLSAWQAKQKTIKIDDVEGLKQCADEVKKWEEEVKKRKLIIQFGYDVSDNLDNLKAQLKEVENLKSMMMSVEFEDEDAQKELTEFLKEVNELNNSTVNIDFELASSPEKLEKEINDLRKKIYEETIKLGLKPEIQKGSLNEIKEKIKAKEQEINILLNTDVDPDSMIKLKKELDDLRKQEREKSIEIGLTKNVATISKNSESWERGSVEDKRQSLSNAQSMVKDIQENYKLNLIGKEEVESQLSEINRKLEELGLKPITLTFNDDGTLTTATEDLDRYKNQMSSVADMAGSMGNVFGSLGGAIGGTTGEVMKFAGQSINAIAQIIPQIVSLIAAKNAEAIASGTASGAAMPFPANIAAIAGIIATIAGVFASLPKFESGGIVGGSSFTGDKLLARVNSGEMILNKTQQRNLYNSMSNAEIGSPMQNTLKGDVTFNISGSALKGTLRNYDSKMSKIK